MKDMAVADVRNFVLLGHTGSGKTTLLDALLFKTGVNDRQGSPADGTSLADWTDEEKERKITMWAKPFDAPYVTPAGRKMRMVMLDTPGYADFYGQAVAASAVADAALLVVDATAGIQVGTNKAWRRCEELGLPRGIVLTGLDKENAHFTEAVEAIQAVWGHKCHPVEVPAQDGHAVVDLLGQGLPAELEKLRGELIEAAAESNDHLIEKYLNGENLSHDEIAQGLREALLHGALIPIFPVIAREQVGLVELLEGIAALFPSPLDRPAKDAAGQPVDPRPEAPLSAQVWRAVNDPFVGQVSFVRVWGGTLKANSDVLNVTKDQKEHISVLQLFNGKKLTPATEAEAGDIVALPKLKATTLNDSLCAPQTAVSFAPIRFPNPTTSYAVTPKTAGDDDKLAAGLHRVTEDDPTIKVQRNTETHELILYGMGDVHLDVTLQRMKKRSHVELVLSTPKVAYQETVTALGEGHYKHKKQSGGRGQYGEVYLRVQPLKAGDAEWFEDALVGTAVPRNFLPAIEKGLLEAMNKGPLSGCKVVGTKVSVYDGSSHEVDSSEIAFKIAAMRAFSDGMSQARPVLKEPIMTLKVMIPEQFMGDITGDLNHKRGRILGIGTEDGMQVITAEAPQAELFRYASELRSITGGRGSFEMDFARYDVVPSNVAQKIIAEAQKHKTAEQHD